MKHSAATRDRSRATTPAHGHCWEPQVPGNEDRLGCRTCGSECHAPEGAPVRYRRPEDRTWSTVEPACQPARGIPWGIPANARRAVRSSKAREALGLPHIPVKQGERCPDCGYGNTPAEALRFAADREAMRKQRAERRRRHEQIASGRPADPVQEYLAQHAADNSRGERAFDEALGATGDVHHAAKAYVVAAWGGTVGEPPPLPAAVELPVVPEPVAVPEPVPVALEPVAVPVPVVVEPVPVVQPIPVPILGVAEYPPLVGSIEDDEDELRCLRDLEIEVDGLNLRAEVEELQRVCRLYEAAAVAFNTRQTYASRWRQFLKWCHMRGFVALPAHEPVVCLYFAWLAKAGVSVSTLEVTYAAVMGAHRAVNLEPPISRRLRLLMRGFRSLLGRRAAHAKAISPALLRQIVSTCGEDLCGVRDRALLLSTYYGALRRSEATALDVEHLERNEAGYVVAIPHSKGDQQSKGAEIGLPLKDDPTICPVLALDRWLAARQPFATTPDIQPYRGAVWLSVRAAASRASGWIVGGRLGENDVGRVLKRHAERAGLDPSRFHAHGLRAGFGTAAADAGASLHQIKHHMRHARLESTLVYIHAAETLGPQNPGRRVQ